MKIKSIIIIIVISIAAIFSSCTIKDDNSPPTQEIVYNDTSLLTGELSVEVLYFDMLSQTYRPAPSGTNIFLFATFDDLENNLPIYAIETTGSNTAYFGFINYGNYYVLAFNNIQYNYFEGVSVVQVRPRRQELLTITMYENYIK